MTKNIQENSTKISKNVVQKKKIISRQKKHIFVWFFKSKEHRYILK